VEEILLLFPYETDCIDYEIESLELFPLLSREGCVLNYLKQLESKKCKSKINWNFELNNKEYSGYNFSFSKMQFKK
jgi:hypothetical protein